MKLSDVLMEIGSLCSLVVHSFPRYSIQYLYSADIGIKFTEQEVSFFPLNMMVRVALVT